MSMRSWFALALLAAPLSAPLAAQEPAPMMHHPAPAQILTSAQGESSVTPDRATLSIGVQTRAATAAQASAENAQKQRAVIDAVRGLGVAPEQISTTDFSVWPEQSFQPDKGDKTPRIVGYNVTNTVRVEVRKLDKLGPVIDAALSRGANQINSLTFSSSNEDDARRSALAAAVARARGDAEAMARAAGGTLGNLVTLSSEGFAPRPIPMAFAGMQAKAEATPISPGEQTVRVSVSASWAFIPASH